jgi:hypothetical protein
MKKKITLSPLGHTWIMDLDGTLVKHNGYKEGGDVLLPGVKEFIDSLPEGDMIVIITARKQEYKDITEKFLKDNGIRYNHIIFEAPYGERIVINDKKPSGLPVSVAVNIERDKTWLIEYKIDEQL